MYGLGKERISNNPLKTNEDIRFWDATFDVANTENPEKGIDLFWIRAVPGFFPYLI